MAHEPVPYGVARLTGRPVVSEAGQARALPDPP